MIAEIHIGLTQTGQAVVEIGGDPKRVTKLMLYEMLAAAMNQVAKIGKQPSPKVVLPPPGIGGLRTTEGE